MRVKTDFMQKWIKDVWLRISLKRKLVAYSLMVIIIILLSAVFSIRLMDFAMQSFDMILDDNSRCHEFQEAMELEVDAFQEYARDRSQEKRDTYVLACTRSERCIKMLPFKYAEVGRERYAITWSVRNAYEKYSESKKAVLEMDQEASGYIPSLYKVYSMQGYLQSYARRLVQATLKDSTDSYHQKAPLYSKMPYMIVLFSAGMIVLATLLTRLMSNALIDPLMKLIGGAGKIAANDFSGEDLVVENKDEMGDVIRAFNKMKHATEGYIATMMKNYEMSELLHKEEMEKMEMEKRLDAARLELLKSQINPHFLFNTLNTIGCMAKLEDAGTTERMITSMSNLFRYNLKTSEQIVPLTQELKVAGDYMYIQQMRFGSRVRYDCDIQVEPSEVMIPAFTLQPLVENGVIHGLSKKEEGGRIYIRIWRSEEGVNISVGDTGLGMSEARLAELEEALKGGGTSRIGIGLGNIYKRIHTMYRHGDFRIYSREGCGTVIQIRIPQEEERGKANDTITDSGR